MRKAFAAIVAVLLLVGVEPVGRAATAPPGRLTLKEKVVQRLAWTGPRSSRTRAVVEKRALKARFDMQADPAETDAFAAGTRISFRLGSLLFDAHLGDAPGFSRLRRDARIAIPGATPGGEPLGEVRVRWTGRHAYVDVKAARDAVLGGIAPAVGRSTIHPYVDSAIQLGGGSWFYAGHAAGKARVKRKSIDGGPVDLVKAKVKLSGLRATLSDDRSPPTIQLLAPANNQFLSQSPVTVNGVATDDRRIAAIFWTLDDDEPVPAPWAVTPGTGGAIPEEGVFYFAVPVTVEGFHRLRVTVRDDAGNQASASLRFVYSVSRPSLLAAGDRFSIAVRDGQTLAWGRGVSGQLGTGELESVPSPSPVAAFAGASAVAAGLTHTLALLPDGTVRACGSNAYGQLGDGSREDRATPAVVPGLTDVVAIAAGNYHSVALRADGTVWSWGANGLAQIGDGTGGGGPIDQSEDRLRPTAAKDLAGVAAIAAGADVTLAILTDGTLRGWGDTHHAQVPGGLEPQVTMPELTDVVEVAVGGVHVIARRADGSVWTWGYRLYGSIGDGSSSDSVLVTPHRVEAATNAIGVSASATSCAVLLASHQVLAWGGNEFGECGLGHNRQQSSPALIAGLDDVVRVTSSGQSVDVLAERSNRTLLGWGRYVTGDPLADAIATRPVPIAEGP